MEVAAPGAAGGKKVTRSLLKIVCFADVPLQLDLPCNQTVVQHVFVHLPKGGELHLCPGCLPLICHLTSLTFGDFKSLVTCGS